MKPLRNYFSLQEDQASIQEIEERIRSNSNVSGSNLFILIFAILIASIGLNMDSTAVVIGAMLISPLMSIITSISYGIVKRNVAWIKMSVARFGLQILISICTSTIYFYISPLNHFSNELLARTQPTLWDALIAICGGMAAIIASTRKNPFSNVIPGAAIATALMPPLCTVGYCIANGKWIPAMGALYLFTINVLFICISAVIGLRIMKISRDGESMSKKNQGFFFAVLIVALIPSIFFGVQSVRQITLEDQFHAFVQNEFDFENAQVVKADISHTDKKIDVALIGSMVSSSAIESIETKLNEYGLQDYALYVTQTQVDQGVSKEQLKEFIENNKNPVETIQKTAKQTQKEMIEELMLLYPDVLEAGFSDVYTKDSKPTFTLLLLVEKKVDTKPMLDWLHTKLEGDIQILQFVKEENDEIQLHA